MAKTQQSKAALYVFTVINMPTQQAKLPNEPIKMHFFRPKYEIRWPPKHPQRIKPIFITIVVVLRSAMAAWPVSWLIQAGIHDSTDQYPMIAELAMATTINVLG